MEDEKASRKKENGKEVTKKGVVIGATALALVLVVAVVAIVLVVARKNTNGDDGSIPTDGVANVGHGRITDGDDNDEEEEFMQDASQAFEDTLLSAESFVVQMSDSTWRFVDSSSPSYDAVIYNAEENVNDMYFTLTVKETQETVLVSETMSPGQKMTDVELDFDAKAGEYPCSMVYHVLDPETGAEYGTLTFAVTVVIEN